MDNPFQHKCQKCGAILDPISNVLSETCEMWFDNWLAQYCCIVPKAGKHAMGMQIRSWCDQHLSAQKATIRTPGA